MKNADPLKKCPGPPYCPQQVSSGATAASLIAKWLAQHYAPSDLNHEFINTRLLALVCQRDR